MPFKSDKQRRFFNSPTGRAKLGDKVVNEFNKASKGMNLPKDTSDDESPSEDQNENEQTENNRLTHRMKI